MRNHQKQLITFVLGLAFLGGCDAAGPTTGTVSGRVTLEGEPVRVGVVSLISDEIGAGAMADLDDQGTFHLRDPLPVGDYQATVMPRRPPGLEEMDAMEAPGYTPPPPPPAEYQPVYSSSGVSITIEPGANERNLEF